MNEEEKEECEEEDEEDEEETELPSINDMLAAISNQASINVESNTNILKAIIRLQMLLYHNAGKKNNPGLKKSDIEEIDKVERLYETWIV